MKPNTVPRIHLLTMAMLFLVACGPTIPRGLKAVTPFNHERYLGKWYEIARFDFRFERDLNNTTATYSLNPDGSIKVDNRGYNYQTGQWKQAIGKAKFVTDANTAMLKVSFFGPFYAGYNVIALDADYNYALISGQSRDYLWILSRQTTIPDTIKQNYLKMAQEAGFDTTKLVWVSHDKVGQEPF